MAIVIWPILNIICQASQCSYSIFEYVLWWIGLFIYLCIPKIGFSGTRNQRKIGYIQQVGLFIFCPCNDFSKFFSGLLSVTFLENDQTHAKSRDSICLEPIFPRHLENPGWVLGTRFITTLYLTHKRSSFIFLKMTDTDKFFFDVDDC